MPCTEAQKRGNIAYNRRRDSITIRPSKEDGGAVRAAASAAGQPVQVYISQACKERMTRDGFKPSAAQTEWGETNGDTV